MNLYEDWKGKIMVPVTTADIGAKVVTGPDFLRNWSDQVNNAVYGIITDVHLKSTYTSKKWLNVSWYNEHDEVVDEDHIYWIDPKDELYTLAYHYDFNEANEWLTSQVVAEPDGSTTSFYNAYPITVGIELYVAHLNSQRHGN